MNFLQFVVLTLQYQLNQRLRCLLYIVLLRLWSIVLFTKNYCILEMILNSYLQRFIEKRINMKVIPTLLLSASLLVFTSQSSAAGDAHHFPGIFVGYTHAESHTEFTYGIEYEYKFNSEWGLGAIYEKTDNAHHGDGVTVKILEAFYHPTSYLRLGVGAGKEKIGGDHPHTEDLYRLSASYEYHIGDFGVAPTLAVDFIDGEEAYVFGVALIRPF